MDIFESLRKALLDAITSLPKLNRDNRKKVRDTVLVLQAEIERALTLAMYYLDGVPRIQSQNELIDHLAAAPMKLLDSYNQYKICAGIYGLADEFEEVFSSLPGAIDVKSIQAVKTLVRDLANGERLVLDGLRNTMLLLADCANELRALNGEAYADKKKIVQDKVALERTHLRNRLDWFCKSISEILTMM